MKDSLGRREFLKHGAIATTAMSVAGPGALVHAGEKASIPVRVLGKTGVKLPLLGFGGAALPAAWGNPLSVEDRVKLVRYAYNKGVRFFDTAGNYLESQSILGKALKGIRQDVFLASKVETTNEKQVRKAVDKVLAELQSTYLDLIQIHGTPGLEQMSVKQAMKIHAELVKLRDEKVVRHVGFTAHSYFDKALALIKTGGFEQCMLSYGYIPRGYNQMWSKRMTWLRDECVAQAHEREMGIVAMKVIGAGVLGSWSGTIAPELHKKEISKLPGAAIRWVLKDKRIDHLAIGMRLPEEIDANIGILTTDTACTKEDEALLAKYSSKAIRRKPLKTFRID
ncbi:MAG: aldo/keto reductase [Planctomycetota bacterium]|jgi:predicted aldo/keto reductase-like oxidoreductase|nr:aldo/keto reductase [Planctomycetota bacterium]MDP7251034.1 aldo/keto reductase [Planctomycetota bacterium]